jgi:hypothetical protein
MGFILDEGDLLCVEVLAFDEGTILLEGCAKSLLIGVVTDASHE